MAVMRTSAESFYRWQEDRGRRRPAEEGRQRAWLGSWLCAHFLYIACFPVVCCAFCRKVQICFPRLTGVAKAVGQRKHWELGFCGNACDKSKSDPGSPTRMHKCSTWVSFSVRLTSLGALAERYGGAEAQ
eukprot:gene13670-biopygen12115